MENKVNLAQLRHSIAYLQAAIDALLDEVDYNDRTGALIDEIVGVAMHNVLLDAGMIRDMDEPPTRRDEINVDMDLMLPPIDLVMGRGQ